MLRNVAAGLWLWVAVLTGVFLLFGQEGRAGAGEGRLVVAVRDATKLAVVTAEALVKCSDGTSRTVRADGEGVVSLINLPAGKLQVEVRAPGFRVWKGSAVLALGGEERLEARLEVGDPGTTVAVKPSAGRRFVDWLTSCTRR